MNEVMSAATADIPRLYTALAEWGACLVYVAAVGRRWGQVACVGFAVGALILLLLVQTWAGALPLPLWIPGMLAAVVCMFTFLALTLRVSLTAAGYLTARAFVLAEFTASLHWQVDRFYLRDASPGISWTVVIATYMLVLVGAYFAERRHFPRGQDLVVGWRELVSAVAIAAATFGISNLSFANANTAFSGRIGSEIFYIRTLVDLCGYIALYTQQEIRRELQSRRDAAAMSQLLHSQHEQSEISRRAMDDVNRKYHDMKHHLDALRAESDPAARELMFAELEESILHYGVRVDSGNRVVDAVLTAKLMQAREQDTEVSLVLDGRLLSFMSPLDASSLLGNAMDNALEATARLNDRERRRIRVALFQQHDFLVLRVENSFDGVINRNGRRIRSRKTEPGHGYGLRNIEAAAERYGGSVSTDLTSTWFTLSVLFPQKSADK